MTEETAVFGTNVSMVAVTEPPAPSFQVVPFSMRSTNRKQLGPRKNNEDVCREQGRTTS